MYLADFCKLEILRPGYKDKSENCYGRSDVSGKVMLMTWFSKVVTISVSNIVDVGSVSRFPRISLENAMI